MECREDGRCGRGNLLAGFIFCRRRHNIGNGIAALGLSRKKCTDEICWGGPGEIGGGGTKKMGWKESDGRGRGETERDEIESQEKRRRERRWRRRRRLSLNGFGSLGGFKHCH